MFTEKELRELRARAYEMADTYNINTSWKRAYTALGDAANILDAFLSRVVVKTSTANKERENKETVVRLESKLKTSEMHLRTRGELNQFLKEKMGENKYSKACVEFLREKRIKYALEDLRDDGVKGAELDRLIAEIDNVK